MNNPTPGADDPDLLVAVQALSAKVAELTGHLSISQDQANRIERQSKKQRFLTKVVASIAALSLAGVIFTLSLLTQVNDAIDGNKANAVTNCQNSNESRRASKVLWDFLIDTSLSSNPEATPEDREVLLKVQAFVAALYAPRDCSDLGRKYELPEPPTLTHD